MSIYIYIYIYLYTVYIKVILTSDIIIEKQDAVVWMNVKRWMHKSKSMTMLTIWGRRRERWWRWCILAAYYNDEAQPKEHIKTASSNAFIHAFMQQALYSAIYVTVYIYMHALYMQIIYKNSK
jgi:hypothetical protein